MDYLYNRGQLCYSRNFYCLFIYYALQAEYAAQYSVASSSSSPSNIAVRGDTSSKMIRRFVHNCGCKEFVHLPPLDNPYSTQINGMSDTNVG